MDNFGIEDKYIAIFLDEILEYIRILEISFSCINVSNRLDIVKTISKTLNDIKCISKAMGANDILFHADELEIFLNRLMDSNIFIDSGILNKIGKNIENIKKGYFNLGMQYSMDKIEIYT